VARETARDAKDLARQMGRREVRAASVAWATREEADHQRTARSAEPSRADRSAGQGGSAPAQDEDMFRRKVREALAARQTKAATPEADLDRGQGAAPMPDSPKRGPGIRECDRMSRPDDAAHQAPEPAPFLPAWHDPTGQGRDSLGRGTLAAELGRVADQDKEVLRHAEDRPGFLPAAYRDPRQAAVALDALIENPATICGSRRGASERSRIFWAR